MDSRIMHDMFALGVPVLEKMARPIVVYAFLVVGLRLGGKRELAQLNPFDLRNDQFLRQAAVARSDQPRRGPRRAQAPLGPGECPALNGGRTTGSVRQRSFRSWGTSQKNSRLEPEVE